MGWNHQVSRPCGRNLVSRLVWSWLVSSAMRLGTSKPPLGKQWRSVSTDKMFLKCFQLWFCLRIALESHDVFLQLLIEFLRPGIMSCLMRVVDALQPTCHRPFPRSRPSNLEIKPGNALSLSQWCCVQIAGLVSIFVTEDVFQYYQRWNGLETAWGCGSGLKHQVTVRTIRASDPLEFGGKGGVMDSLHIPHVSWSMEYHWSMMIIQITSCR